MAKHTEGPWSVICREGEWLIYGADNFKIHDTFNAAVNGMEIVEANARLIACAPHLLEVCKEAQAVLRQGLQWNRFEPGCRLDRLLKRLREAIAKAEGGNG